MTLLFDSGAAYLCQCSIPFGIHDDNLGEYDYEGDEYDTELGRGGGHDRSWCGLCTGEKQCKKAVRFWDRTKGLWSVKVWNSTSFQRVMDSAHHRGYPSTSPGHIHFAWHVLCKHGIESCTAESSLPSGITRKRAARLAGMVVLRMEREQRIIRGDN